MTVEKPGKMYILYSPAFLKKNRNAIVIKLRNAGDKGGEAG